MKHRSYRRRGDGISGSAHKRKAWKQIMKSRGEFVPQKSWSGRGRGGGGAGRSGACFKCGQEGHWAKNCRGPKRNGSSLGSNLKSWYVCQAVLRHKGTFDANFLSEIMKRATKMLNVVNLYLERCHNGPTFDIMSEE